MVSPKNFIVFLSLNTVLASATVPPVPVETTKPSSSFGVAGGPVDESGPEIHYCTRKRWKGDCYKNVMQPGVCHNMGPEWDNNTECIGNKHTYYFKCSWYLDRNCKGSKYENQWDADLTDGNGKFGNSISSFFCKWQNV